MILCFAILFTVKCKYFKGYFDSKYDKRISHLLCVCDLKFSSKRGSSKLLFHETFIVLLPRKDVKHNQQGMVGFQPDVPLLKRLVRRPASRELCSYPLSCSYDSEHLYLIKLCYTDSVIIVKLQNF